MTPEEKSLHKREYLKAYYARNAEVIKQRAKKRYERVRDQPEVKASRHRAVEKWFAKKALDPQWVEKRRAEKRAAYAANPEPFKMRTRLRDPEKKRAYNLKGKYGITVEEFERMLEAQDHRCAICICAIDAPREDEKRWNYRCIDHDHATDKVRSVPCRRCNVVLGQIGDSVELLEAFIVYLKHHRAVA